MTKIASRKADPLFAPVADIPASDGVVTRSDNRPTPAIDAVAAFDDALRQREGFIDRIDALIAASERAIANDDETAGRCADLQRQISAAAKVVDGEREMVKRPYLEAGRAVDEAAKRHSVRLNGALQSVRGKIETYARQKLREQEQQRQREIEAQRERKRIAQEEAEKARAAGEPVPDPEPVAPAPPPPKPTLSVRGDYGSVASVQKVWKGEIEDWNKAFKAVSSNENVRDAVQKAVNALIRSGTREIKGVRIYEDVGVRVR